MNFKYLSWLFIGLMLMVVSCEEDEDDEELIGNWIEKSEFDGYARSQAVAFSIGKNGYLGTGYDGTDRLDDFWVYDSENNYWTQIADYPGGGVNSAVAFSINGKGYVGTGYDGINKRNDFYEYDPTTKEWTQKTNFSGSERYGAVGLAIGDTGYITCGYDGSYLKDFWRYDPTTDSWEQRISMGGSKRRDAVGFSIDGKGYLCAGISNGEYENDLWMYYPSTGLWEEKREIADVNDDEDYDDDYDMVRSDGVAFVIDNRAYLATGTSGSLRGDVWEYEPLSDLWERKSNFEGAARTDAVAFSIEGSRGFVLTGRNGSYAFEDIWEFKPDDELDVDD